MTQTWVILEGSPKLAACLLGRSPTCPPPPRLSRASLTPRERLELRQTPHISLAPVLPLQLSSANVEAQMSLGPGSLRCGGGEGVTVALLDSGVDITHEAFASSCEITQRDFLGGGGGDPNGHGTYCASVIFGARGLAPDIERALSGRVVGSLGDGDSHALYEGLLWACEERADIVCVALNLGFASVLRAARAQFESEALAHAWALDAYAANAAMLSVLTMYARARDTLIIASTGNDARTDHRPPPTPPASLPGVLAVGGIERTPQGLWRAVRTTNVPADLGAPGAGVLGADIRSQDAWCHKTGSSMAAACAAGVAAQWRSKTGAQAWERMLSSATTEGFVGGEETLFGWGRLQGP